MLLSLDIQDARQLARRQQLHRAKRQAEQSQTLRHHVGGVAPAAMMYPFNALAHHGRISADPLPPFPLCGACPSGFSTTLMQPSCLSRKVRYISGPSFSATVWVMTKLGSIC